jgi:carbonic anhydrase
MTGTVRTDSLPAAYQWTSLRLEKNLMNARRFCRVFLLILTLSVVDLLVVSAAQEAHTPHWTYEGKEGPKEWGNLDSSYAACSVGKTQSPIDIKGARQADLPVLNFSYHAIPLGIIDNGHTIQVNYAPGSTVTVGEKHYTLQQFHFHHPSEEHVNGKDFPLVAHLVHSDAEGHLAVIAVLFELGKANPLIDTLWKNIPAVKEKPHDIPSISIQAQDLLPNERSYFTYAGSLTTPPCSEGVSWYVLSSHSTISPQQLAAFAKIYPMNARPIQPTNGREILFSK